MAKKPAPKLGDLVKCSWLDAFATAADDYDQEMIDNAKAHKMTTYGLLIRHDLELSGLIGLATETSEDGYYRGVTFIPVSIVASIETVRAKSKPKTSKTPSPPASS